MKRSVKLWQLFGFAITSLIGTLLHFLYEWLDESKWIAPFSGVNESTWEHMKLLFWPMFAFSVFQSFFFKDYECFWCIKLNGTLIGLGLIPILFYTYNGIIGKSPNFINIAIFFVSAAATYLYEAVMLDRDDIYCKSSRTAILFLTAIAILFVIFTFATPEINIFKDPINGSYGI